MPGSRRSELRQPGTNAPAGSAEMRPHGSRTAWLRHRSRPRRFDWPPVRPRRCPGTEPDVRNHATRLPSCRTAPELRPLATARPRRFEWSAWGTQQFLGRGAQRPQSPSRGKWPGGFDPEELFGAAWWLTHSAKVAAQRTGVRAYGPVVTTRKRTYVFHGDTPSLDFRGHRVVRPGIVQRQGQARPGT